MGKEGFWNDVENANKVNRRMKAISSKLDKYQHLMSRCEDLETLIEMADEENDESLVPEVQSEFASLEKDIEALKLEALLKGPYDSYNAVLSLHAGAGGTEAQDWVSLLYRMYTRYCEKMGYSVKVIDYLDGEEAGIKSVTFEVDGDNAYGYLKAEKGVHRLVRISPFDSSGRRHTSFASLDVTPIFDDDTNDVEIDMDDLRIDTYRSGGAGGQNVNKVSSAIRITHFPTGIVVQCQNERSQLHNKDMAMRILKGKLLELAERERLEHMAEIKGYAEDFDLLQKVEELGIPLIQERRKSDAPMCANVDMYSGLVYTMLGIPEDVFTPLFASARIAGWCANRIEEVVTCHRIMRPAYRAVTIRGKYVPMEERTASKAL